MDRTTLTRSLQLLSNRQLLQFQAASGDARRRELTLTEAGEEIIALAFPMWSLAQQVTREDLGTDYVDALLAAARAVTFGPPPAPTAQQGEPRNALHIPEDHPGRELASVSLTLLPNGERVNGKEKRASKD